MIFNIERLYHLPKEISPGSSILRCTLVKLLDIQDKGKTSPEFPGKKT